MPENNDLTMHVPISGEVLLRINGVEGLHTMGAFEYEVPVTLAVTTGRVGFDWTPKVWEEAINTKGIGAPTPKPSVGIYPTIIETLDGHSQSARNQRCECGWQPVDTSIANPASIQHRNHLAEKLMEAVGAVLDV